MYIGIPATCLPCGWCRKIVKKDIQKKAKKNRKASKQKRRPNKTRKDQGKEKEED